MTLNKKTKQRYIMLAALLALILCCIGLHVSDTANPVNQTKQTMPSSQSKVFTPDWGIAATLTSLQYPPFAVGDKKSYAFRVESPALPESVINTGYRAQPNPELLAQLQADVIINTTTYKQNTAIYPRNIPLVLTDYRNHSAIGERPQWSQFTTNIYDIANAINQPQIADPYIKHSRQRIIEAGENIRKHIGDDRKIIVSNFWDMRQMSVFNYNSNINLAAQMMGLELISIGELTKWGTAYIYTDKLYDLPPETCLIIMEPVLEFTKYDNVNSPIWQRSPFFSPDACLYRIAPVWTNNGIESMVTFANNLEAAVVKSTINDISYGFVHHQDANKYDK